VIGDVALGDDCSVCSARPCAATTSASLWAPDQRQDGATLHTDSLSARHREDCTIAQRDLHGCTIGAVR